MTIKIRKPLGINTIIHSIDPVLSHAQTLLPSSGGTEANSYQTGYHVPAHYRDIMAHSTNNTASPMIGHNSNNNSPMLSQTAASASPPQYRATSPSMPDTEAMQI